MHKFVRSLITEWRKIGLPFSDETIVVLLTAYCSRLTPQGGHQVKVLVIEDDRSLSEVLSYNLKQAGYDADRPAPCVRPPCICPSTIWWLTMLPASSHAT